MKRIIFSLLLTGSVPVFSQSSSNCLVADFPFSSDAIDESGQGNTITLHGPALTTDRFGNENSAYYFDGIDDYMEVADASGLGFEGDGTISFWVKQSGDVGSLLWKRSYAGSTGWTIYYGFTNTIIGYVNEDAAKVNGSTTSDVWQHVAMVSNAGTMQLYINGTLVDSKANAAGFQKSTTPLLIGTDENENYFNGVIDNISLYNCALTSAEILSIYNETSDCLVGDFPFNGNAIDESGLENSLTLHGPTLTIDRFGNENSAYFFDGVNDYMEVADAFSLDFEGNGTISFWVKQSGDAGSLLWKRNYVGSTGWTIYYGSSNSLIAYVNEDATNVQGSTTSDVWQQVVMVSNAGTMQLYINGALVDSKANAAGFQTSNTPLLIGTDENGNYFHGTIDDIRLYNCALESDQIESRYNSASIVTHTSESTESYFELYPNPAKDKINLSNAHSSDGQMEITLLNSSGERMLSNTVEDAALTTLDVSQYPKGIYLLKIQMGNTVVSKKIIVQ